MATPAAAAPKKLLPPPPPTPEFPKKWPEKPILRKHDHPFFVGSFLLQVHPQNFVMYDRDNFTFGIKNPTDHHVQYCLKLGQEHNHDLGLLTIKGAVANNGVLKPGEIVKLKMYRCPHVDNVSGYDYVELERNHYIREVIISYCILDSQKKIDEALKYDPSNRWSTFVAKGSYHQKISVESPEDIQKELEKELEDRRRDSERRRVAEQAG